MTVKIHSTLWKVCFVSAKDNMLMRSDGSISVGVTDNRTKTIYISDVLQGRFLEKVVTHELVHAFSFSYGIYIPVDIEEQIADFLATYGREVFNVADRLLQEITGIYKAV